MSQHKKNLEKWVLIPLNLFLWVWIIWELFHKNWSVAGILFVIAMIVGGIGQSLHKDKTTAQLYRGEHVKELMRE